MDEPLLLMICSPSGAGKSTLTRHLLASVEGLTFSVSHTTRGPRTGEVDGVHYHFVDRPEFEQEVAAGRFAEWAEVHGNLYGTSLEEIVRARDNGHTGIIFDIDIQGARQLRAARPEVVGIFILPPSMAELRRRLESRASDTPEVIARRMQKARDEIEHYGTFDYLVLNDDLEIAQRDIVAVVRASFRGRRRTARDAEALLRLPAD